MMKLISIELYFLEVMDNKNHYILYKKLKIYNIDLFIVKINKQMKFNLLLETKKFNF